MRDHIVLGADIGGSHITAALVDLNTGSSVKETEIREPLNANGTADEIISLWSDVIKRVCSKGWVTIEQIGIAIPGPFDYNNGISWMKNQNKYDSLYGLNVKDLLAEKLNVSSKSIRFLNDAESFLKGEVFSGAAKDTCRVIGLTFGTGLGSARYINGEVTDADLWRSPFMNGIAEDYLSARWFVARHLSLTGKTVKGVKELAVLAKKNVAVLEIFKEFGNNLSLFLKDIIYKDRPGMIVLGGNIADAFDLFCDQLYTQLNNNKPEIKKAILGEQASLIGAATCWNEIKILQDVRA